MSDESRNVWNWGFTSGAENWNGRLAMIGFVSALAIELILANKKASTSRGFFIG
jgi:hypothetical protein